MRNERINISGEEGSGICARSKGRHHWGGRQEPGSATCNLTTMRPWRNGCLIYGVNVCNSQRATAGSGLCRDSLVAVMARGPPILINRSDSEFDEDLVTERQGNHKPLRTVTSRLGMPSQSARVDLSILLMRRKEKGGTPSLCKSVDPGHIFIDGDRATRKFTTDWRNKRQGKLNWKL